MHVGDRRRARWKRTARAARETVDMERVRAAVHDVVESPRLDVWLRELPDPILIAIAAPLEMLGFQYHLEPPSDRHLVRAARVAYAAVASDLYDCPADFAEAFRSVGRAVAE